MATSTRSAGSATSSPVAAGAGRGPTAVRPGKATRRARTARTPAVPASISTGSDGHPPVSLHQVGHRVLDPGQAGPGDVEPAVALRPRGEHDGVEPVSHVIALPARVDAHLEANALGQELVEAAVDQPLLEFELGDAVAEEAAGEIVALEHGDPVSRAGQLLGGCEAGRAASDDRDRAAGERLRGPRPHPPR